MNLIPVLFTYNQYNELNRILNNIHECIDIDPIRILSNYYDISCKNNCNSFEYVSIQSLSDMIPNKHIFLIVKNPELCLLYRYRDEITKRQRYFTVNLKSGLTLEIDIMGFNVLCTKEGRRGLNYSEKQLNDISKIEIQNFYKKINETMNVLDNNNNGESKKESEKELEVKSERLVNSKTKSLFESYEGLTIY